MSTRTLRSYEVLALRTAVFASADDGFYEGITEGEEIKDGTAVIHIVRLIARYDSQKDGTGAWAPLTTPRTWTGHPGQVSVGEGEDSTVRTYDSQDVAWNQAAALRRWQEVPHHAINTDGVVYEVTPHVLTAEDDASWWQTSPEELEAALLGK